MSKYCTHGWLLFCKFLLIIWRQVKAEIEQSIAGKTNQQLYLCVLQKATHNLLLIGHVCITNMKAVISYCYSQLITCVSFPLASEPLQGRGSPSLSTCTLQCQEESQTQQWSLLNWCFISYGQILMRDKGRPSNYDRFSGHLKNLFAVMSPIVIQFFKEWLTSRKMIDPFC